MILILLALVMGVLPATSSGQHSEAWAVGPYTIERLESSCSMATTVVLPGRSDIVLHWLYEGEATAQADLVVQSDDWSSIEGQIYNDFVFQFYEPSGFVEGIPVEGMTATKRGGFHAVLPIQALDAFGSASTFFVARGTRESPTRILNLDLRGSGAAVTSLKRCGDDLARQRAAIAGEAARFDSLSSDPFANEHTVSRSPDLPRVDD